ncbi:Amicyanin-alpha [Thermoflexales bacterium]|nr:Amicyanin-alpha [Thermoflexales bacterium]
MFAFSVQHPLKMLGIALVVPLAFFLTLTAVLDLPSVQASHHTAVRPSALNDPSFKPGPSHPLTDPSTPSAGVDIAISGFAFNPAVVTITVGTVVTWTNLDAAPHTSTSDVGSTDPWDSGTLNQNEIFTRTFNTPGVYGYHCGIHPAMQGTVVVLAAQPQQAPLSMSIAGPRGGVADVTHTFTATVSPITATQPITYFWQATGQTPVTHTDKGLSDTLAFTWSAAAVGPQLITVTAENSAGSVSKALTVTIVPPAGEDVTDVSIINFAFQPRVITISVGSTVRWINADQAAHTSTSVVSSTENWDSGNLASGQVFTHTFNTPGTFDYLCTLHLSMQGTVVVLAAESQQAPLAVNITGPSNGGVDVAHTFTATVSPITTTQPITYFWQATGQAPVTHIGQGLSDTRAFTWSAANAGPQLITVTAENSAGSVSATHAITIALPVDTDVTEVSIVDFAFQPQVITISVGSTVRWTNTGLQAHTSTSAGSSSEVWDSGNLDPGEVYTRTFNAAGVYDYLCAIHPAMEGTVVVLAHVYLPLVLR